jgi:hypothetical protein
VDVDAYLTFFEHVLVRKTVSMHQKAIAALYCDFVRESDDPVSIPSLIPELRYEVRECQA